MDAYPQIDSGPSDLCGACASVWTFINKSLHCLKGHPLPKRLRQSASRASHLEQGVCSLDLVFVPGPKLTCRIVMNSHFTYLRVLSIFTFYDWIQT